MLTGVDDELCRYPQCPQRLIHLLAADDRNIEILVSAQKERWSADAVRVEEGIRHLEPQRRVGPRRAEFIVVLENVFVTTVRRELIGTAGPADGGLEAVIGRNGVIGQYAAVAPSADREPISVRDAARDQVIHTGQEILDLFVAPIAEYGFR